MTAKITRLIAFMELSIGSITIAGLTLSGLLHLSSKSPAVFTFVFISSLISLLIGSGLWNYRYWARILILFFSGYIIITKLLLFSGLIKLNGELITFIPEGLKDLISIFYHSFVFLFFNLRPVKERFCAR